MAQAKDIHEEQGSGFRKASHMMRLVGGPLLAASMAGLVAANFELIAMPTAITIAVVGAAMTIGGYIGEYISTPSNHKKHDATSESKAIEEARGLVQELKATGQNVTFAQNARNDGRSWVQATGKGGAGMQPTV